MTLEFFELPKEFPNFHPGNQVTLKREEVQDWSIHRNGTLIGGFSGRLNRQRFTEEERRQFDLFSGTISCAPIDEVLELKSRQL